MDLEPIFLRVVMRVLYSAALICALTAAMTPPAAGQSLADAAKKEEERRKAVKAAGKVYTNKDLGAPSGPTPAAPSGAQSPAPSAPPAKPEEKPAEQQEPAKDQAYWAERMKGLRAQLERNQTLADALQTQINSLSADFVNRDDPAQRAVLGNERQRAQAELDRLRKQIEADKKAIADLEEEARRAGVPPGWLR
jgi:hypothetical protein